MQPKNVTSALLTTKRSESDDVKRHDDTNDKLGQIENFVTCRNDTVLPC